jgi:hypothetical protein
MLGIDRGYDHSSPTTFTERREFVVAYEALDRARVDR